MPPSHPRATSSEPSESSEAFEAPSRAGSPFRSLQRLLAAVLARLPRVQVSWPRSPRTRAALCYAIPLVPAFVLLLRERRSHYVRLHAARGVLFFGLILLTQSALLLWLVVLGNLVTTRWLAVALGLLFYLAVLVMGLIILITWLRCLAGALTGRAISPSHLDSAARWLERRARHRDWPAIAEHDGLSRPQPASSQP